MTTWLYQQPSPPTHVYHRATSAYTAAVQLYARSGQLTTAEKVEERQGEGNGGKCWLGCSVLEDEHHIFVDRPVFDEWRKEAGTQLHKTLSERLKLTGLGGNMVSDIVERAKFFYEDNSERWPLRESTYYLGLVPKIERWITPECGNISRITKERIIKGIYCDWHNTGVRLLVASRIYGELQHQVTKTWEGSKGIRG